MEIKSLNEELKERFRSGVNINSVPQCIHELVLNSIDSKSTAIAVRVNLISFRLEVVDNGEGITQSNLNLVGKPYMTSKCHSLEDYKKNLKFYGFRGETLSTLTKISKKLTLTTRYLDNEQTFTKIFEFKKPPSLSSTAQRPSQGTTVTVEDFLFNLPIRQSRVNPELDLVEIKRNLECLSVVHPGILFSLRNDLNKRMVYKSDRFESAAEALGSLIPQLDADQLVQIKVSKDKTTISGLIYRREFANNKFQFVYVNKRPVSCSKLQKFVETILASRLSQGNQKPKNFVYVLNIKCPYAQVEFTCHPGKVLVEFRHWDLIYKCLEKALNKFLVKDIVVEEEKLESVESLKKSGKLSLSVLAGVCKGTAKRTNQMEDEEDLREEIEDVRQDIDDLEVASRGRMEEEDVFKEKQGFGIKIYDFGPKKKSKQLAERKNLKEVAKVNEDFEDVFEENAVQRKSKRNSRKSCRKTSGILKNTSRKVVKDLNGNCEENSNVFKENRRIELKEKNDIKLYNQRVKMKKEKRKLDEQLKNKLVEIEDGNEDINFPNCSEMDMARGIEKLEDVNLKKKLVETDEEFEFPSYSEAVSENLEKQVVGKLSVEEANDETLGKALILEKFLSCQRDFELEDLPEEFPRKKKRLRHRLKKTSKTEVVSNISYKINKKRRILKSKNLQLIEEQTLNFTSSVNIQNTGFLLEENVCPKMVSKGVQTSTVNDFLQSEIAEDEFDLIREKKICKSVQTSVVQTNSKGKFFEKKFEFPQETLNKYFEEDFGLDTSKYFEKTGSVCFTQNWGFSQTQRNDSCVIGDKSEGFANFQAGDFSILANQTNFYQNTKIVDHPNLIEDSYQSHNIENLGKFMVHGENFEELNGKLNDLKLFHKKNSRRELPYKSKFDSKSKILNKKPKSDPKKIKILSNVLLKPNDNVPQKRLNKFDPCVTNFPVEFTQENVKEFPKKVNFPVGILKSVKSHFSCRKFDRFPRGNVCGDAKIAEILEKKISRKASRDCLEENKISGENVVQRGFCKKLMDFPEGNFVVEDRKLKNSLENQMKMFVPRQNLFSVEKQKHLDDFGNFSNSCFRFVQENAKGNCRNNFAKIQFSRGNDQIALQNLENGGNFFENSQYLENWEKEIQENLKENGIVNNFKLPLCQNEGNLYQNEEKFYENEGNLYQTGGNLYQNEESLYVNEGNLYQTGGNLGQNKGNYQFKNKIKENLNYPKGNAIYYVKENKFVVENENSELTEPIYKFANSCENHAESYPYHQENFVQNIKQFPQTNSHMERIHSQISANFPNSFAVSTLEHSRNPEENQNQISVENFTLNQNLSSNLHRKEEKSHFYSKYTINMERQEEETPTNFDDSTKNSVQNFVQNLQQFADNSHLNSTYTINIHPQDQEEATPTNFHQNSKNPVQTFQTSSPNLHQFEDNSTLNLTFTLRSKPEQTPNADEVFRMEIEPEIEEIPQTNQQIEEEIPNEWTKETAIDGNTFFINQRTGMSSVVNPEEDRNYDFARRLDFVPKGLSPILRKNREMVETALSQGAKENLFAKLVQSYEEELGTVKWKNFIKNKDPKIFFDAIYSERNKKLSNVPNIAKFSANLKPSTSIRFDKEILKELKVIGQLDCKFIVALSNSNLILLFDQHAVHERIRLENLYKEYSVDGVSYNRSKLDKFVNISLPETDATLVKTYEFAFENFGLKFGQIAGKTLQISEVPSCFLRKADKDMELLKNLIKALIDEQIDWIRNTRGIVKRVPKIVQNVINSEACRGSVMFGDKLTLDECAKFISGLSACSLPFQCAHGRPTLAPILELQNANTIQTKKPNLRCLK